MDPDVIEIIEWDDFALDPAGLTLRRGGEPVELEPKAIRVLIHLVRNRHRVVTKEELMAEVWAGTFVTDNALTRVIAQIRKQLGDNARSPRYVETATSAGYRFIAEVRVAAGEPLVATPASRSGRRWPPVPRYALVVAAVVAALGVWLFRPIGGPPVRLANVRQLTRSVATELWPCFSPDGSQVAYSSNRSGVFEIYVASLAPGSAERQLTNDGQENIQPAWSPDGRSLAYVTRRKGGIALVPVSGGVIRHLTDRGDSPAWSPDSRLLAFRAGSLEMNPAMETTGIRGTTIWVVGADGSGVRALTRDGAPVGGHNFPRWTPSGRHVIFTSGPERNAPNGYDSRPWAVDIATGSLEPIRIEAAVVRSPSISADGDHFYYVSDGFGGPGLWHAPLRGFRAGSAEVLMPAGGATPRDLSLSADGRRVVFSQQTGESALWSVHLDARGKPAGEPRPILADRSFRNTEPLFSPDGERIAYSSFRQGGESSVMVAGADGSNPIPLSDPEHVSNRPSWREPDGALGFRSMHKGQWSYWMVQQPGAMPASVGLKLDLERTDRLRLSPDGKQIAAHITTPAGMLVVVEDLATHVVRKVTPENKHCGFPFWSRDGRWLGVSMRVDGKNRLAYLPAGGGPVRELQTGKVQALGFDWSPDSDKIAFAGLEDGVWNIYWISLSSGAVEQLTRFTSHVAFVRYPTWSPKGDQIVFENNSLSANIYVADVK